MKRQILLGLVSLCLVGSSLATAAPRQIKRITPGNRATVLLFVASQCPCTDQHRVMVNRLLETATPQGVNFYCIFSNQGENRERVEHFFRSIGWNMEYLMDFSGKYADQYQATHTPQAFLIDTDGSVLFNGPIDDSAKNQGRVDHPYLKEAVEAYLAGQPIARPQVPPAGCWIMRPGAPQPVEAELLN